ncbi:MAG: DUF2007 domain-containing protein [Oceanicoccus sp.]
MKPVYTHQNIIIVSAAKNILENNGINCFIKNEFSNTMGGELGLSNIWAELWVSDPEDFDRAKKLLTKELASDMDKPDWKCPNCQELNGYNFAFCWKCGSSN